jgi:hypothetical protein
MARRAIVLLSLISLGLTGMLGSAWADGNGNTDHKVQICKLVGKPTPGDVERVKGGKQPIVVDEHALNGPHFSDAQQSPQFPGPCAAAPPVTPPTPPGPPGPPAAPKVQAAAPQVQAAAPKVPAAAPAPAAPRAPVAAVPAPAPAAAVRAAPPVTG